MQSSLIYAAILVLAALAPLLPGQLDLPFFGSPHQLTLTVNDTTDAVDANPGDGSCATATGACSLRAAIQEANARAGADVVVVPAGRYELSVESDEDEQGGDLDITTEIEIRGGGAAATIVVGPDEDRVMEISTRRGDATDPVVVEISGLTIEGGHSAVGGGIYVRGDAEVNLTGLHVRDNNADLGGGIYFTGDAALTLDGSTLAGNTAGQGGGIFIGKPGPQTTTEMTPTLQNSTLTGNTAEVGGGLANAGRVWVNSLTISGNTADRGAGIFNSETLDIVNTIAGPNEGPDCTAEGAAVDTHGGNLDSDGTCSLSQGLGDLPSTDPLLGPLGGNGGETPTLSLLPGSPAIDAALAQHCLAVDQRGVARPQGAACDIGAFESEGETPTDTPDVPTPGVTPTDTDEPTPTPPSPSPTTMEPTATSMGTTSTPVSPTPTATRGTQPPTPTALPGQVCTFIIGRVPTEHINAVVANPDTAYGWGQLCYPSVPPSRFNMERSWLSIRNIAEPYHPLFNPLIWKCGCP